MLLPVAASDNPFASAASVICAPAMTHPSLRWRALLCVVLFAVLLPAQTPQETNPSPNPSPAMAVQTQPPAQAPQVPPQLTKEDLEAFLDGVVPIQLQTRDIAGAVVAVVKDGQVLFAKGYGFADVKSRKPVSAEDTLFRPGSISKTFTWTAVMQLVEQGKIDLDRDSTITSISRFLRPLASRSPCAT